MQIGSSILKLRIIAFFLFLISIIALIGSLLFHNYLVSFNHTYEPKYGFTKNVPGEKFKIQCDEKNNFCNNLIFGRSTKLDKCNKFIVEETIFTEEADILENNENIQYTVTKFKKDIFIEYKIIDKLNENCISNLRLRFFFYKLAPFIFEKTYKLKKSSKTSLGTSKAVNPIIYGETSISNIVKRYPVKIIFKPLMYLSVILMLAYWYFNNFVLNKLLRRQKNNIFYIFGILSAIFLLLHVIFLGWSFENEIFSKGRRYFIVFFILFEVLAQAYLIIDIFKNKSDLNIFLNNVVINLKLLFVFLVCLSTALIVSILAIYDLSNKFDYVLEWNYFLILLLFYLLSSLLWRKQNQLFSNPTSS